MASNIRDQLKDQIDEIRSNRLLKYFRDIDDVEKEMRKRSQNYRMTQFEQVLFALSQGFYMHTCRWL